MTTRRSKRSAALRFTGDVWAVPEGQIVFAGEPLLEVTALIAEAQLVETCLLNQITFQTAVASEAARCRIAAGGRTSWTSLPPNARGGGGHGGREDNRHRRVRRLQ
jgi:nicotinic acid phosphoribosyltransferase